MGEKAYWQTISQHKYVKINNITFQLFQKLEIQVDYTQVLESIKSASLFDLYRLNVAIRHEMENPLRILALRNSFAVGQSISYFNAKMNTLV